MTKKWSLDMNSNFTEEEIQRANKHKKMLKLISYQGYAN